MWPEGPRGHGEWAIFHALVIGLGLAWWRMGYKGIAIASWVVGAIGLTVNVLFLL